MSTIVQPSLFEPPETGRSRRRDPITSIAAGRQQRGGAEQAILSVLRTVTDATRDEIAGQLPDWHPPTLSTALSRLLKGGAVARTGAARPSRRHQLQEVVQICDVGHAFGRSRDGEPSITPGGRRPRPVSSPTPNEWKDTA